MDNIQIKESFNAFVLVLPNKNEALASGLLLPAAQKEKPKTGKVIAFGADAKQMNKGELVMFAPHSGVEISINGVDHLILHQRDVYCSYEIINQQENVSGN